MKDISSYLGYILPFRAHLFAIDKRDKFEKKSKIRNCRTKLIVCSFETYWREKQTCGIHNTLLPKFRKIQTKNKMAVIVVLFSVNRYFQKCWIKSILPHLKSVCLVKSFQMSNSIRWTLSDNVEVLTLMIWVTDLLWARGDQISKLSRHFGTACFWRGWWPYTYLLTSLYAPKTCFWDTLIYDLRWKNTRLRDFFFQNYHDLRHF